MLLAKVDPVHLVCLGLGKPTLNRCSQYQLALLVLLKEHFQPSCLAFDPIFSETDKAVLVELGIEVARPEARHISVSKFEPVLYFMPHCSLELFDDVLSHHWGPALSTVAILGNRFSLYQELYSDDHLSHKAPYIAQVFSSQQEISLSLRHDFEVSFFFFFR